jgi:hypothetical protein
MPVNNRFLIERRMRRNIMALVNITSRKTANRRGKAVAIQLRNEDLRQTSLMRDAMILLVIVMLGTAVATHAFAAGRMGGGLDGGFRGAHMSHGFQPPILNQGPTMPAPTFNSSHPYTVPQSPETPVSPASPGSIFGNG